MEYKCLGITQDYMKKDIDPASSKQNDKLLLFKQTLKNITF